MTSKSCLSLLFTLFSMVLFAQTPAIQLVKEAFIFESAPFPSCHASSIVELGKQHLMATWFGGTAESNPDVCIWTSEYKNGQWSVPKLMADGVIDATKRYPTWNPVLFKTKEGKLMLFYKVGPNPREWWEWFGFPPTMEKHGLPLKTTRRYLGTIKNKPIQLANGDILYPTSTESLDAKVWHVYLEKSDKNGKTGKK
ncbi:MAG: exo-alpha-sialidase [Spirosomataceae bacterium]